MTNPTSNFGWQMPTSTDLVTDLPADFETFGQAVDTSMADLKGGTTGQILSKATDTNMDFVWITNDVGDITAVTAGTGISGGGTSGAVTVTNSMATTITTKGDLVPGTGSGTFARLAAGNNGETLVADSSTSTGLRWTGTPSASNPILNSAFQIWQRGTSFAASASARIYTADRWAFYRGSYATGATISRQVTGDTTNLPFIQYAARVQRDSGNTSTTVMYFDQSMESINAIPFAGKTVTVSFYARAGANYSNSSNYLGAYLFSGTGTDQNPLTITGQATAGSSVVTLTTTWQRFTFTASIASTATELIFQTLNTPTGTAGAADYYDITGVQIDIGSVALPFRTNGGTIQGELAAAQRYYYRNTPGVAYGNFATGFTTSTGTASFAIPFPVTMRVAPSSVETTGTASNYAVLNTGGTIAACSAVTYDSNTSKDQGILSPSASSLTTGQGTQLRANNSVTAYIGWSAEL
jgi:hypothetical protein